jgi:ABC-type transport system substrate-binding protein
VPDLVEYDENLAIKPALAERWDASPDGVRRPE